jgi:primosomal protein N' (replication factor Y)
MTDLFGTPPGELVEVALPVPLRQAFTYQMPDGEVAPPAGSRVAVPFHGRKLAGIVLGPAELPEGFTPKRVAGVLDEALFGAELLAFLKEAAAYYLHPIGEVLRAAAPALEGKALASLREEGFLDRGERLGGPEVPTRTRRFVRRAAAAEPGRLGARQAEVWAALAEGELPMDALRERARSAADAVRSLRKRGLVEVEDRDVPADPFFRDRVARDTPPTLIPAQAAALVALREALASGRPHGHLLHGVTGSGKTEVYLHIIGDVLAEGRGAILLVPEIALTPQLVGRFRARFGDALAVLHSGLTPRERLVAWRGLREGRLRIAVGARSALFAPVADLGVLVVDEEHDSSFKQEEGFRYHARDMALLRAHRAEALCVLGSATPSIEIMHRAREGLMGLSIMPERATPHPLPKVEVVDLRRTHSLHSAHPLLSGPLTRALERCLDEDGQAILFLNRRGFAPSLRCGACGHFPECPHCSVSLTEHRRQRTLRCHYCDHGMRTPERCPSCGQTELEPMGLGTERLEAALADAFPRATIGRLDRDTAAGGRGVEKVLQRMRRREIDVLVGTQMVTKGHDLPGVTLVGVVLADQSLAFPDFRAAERTFQLLSQVAGRAGRGGREGKVLFQTFQPEHHAVRFAREHDYDGFYEAELAERRDIGYAPFGRFVAVRLDDPEEAKVRGAALDLAERVRQLDPVRREVVILNGPAPSPILRLRNRYRYRLLLRSRHRGALRAVARHLVEWVDGAKVRGHVDIDPVSML